MSYTQEYQDNNAKLIGGVVSALIAFAFLFYVFVGFGASVSQDEYESLRDGMTYQEVVQVIGGEGSLVADMGIMGARIRSYQWHGPSTKMVVLNFDGNRLSGKMMM